MKRWRKSRTALVLTKRDQTRRKSRGMKTKFDYALLQSNTARDYYLRAVHIKIRQKQVY